MYIRLQRDSLGPCICDCCGLQPAMLTRIYGVGTFFEDLVEVCPLCAKSVKCSEPLRQFLAADVLDRQPKPGFVFVVDWDSHERMTSLRPFLSIRKATGFLRFCKYLDNRNNDRKNSWLREMSIPLCHRLLLDRNLIA